MREVLEFFKKQFAKTKTDEEHVDNCQNGTTEITSEEPDDIIDNSEEEPKAVSDTTENNAEEILDTADDDSVEFAAKSDDIPDIVQE